MNGSSSSDQSVQSLVERLAKVEHFRSLGQSDLETIVLAVIHGVAGMIIFLLPTILAAQGVTRPGFALVGLGGALIGLGGLLLSFLKAGKPILPRTTILRILPALLLLMTAAFVAGFALA